MAAVRGAQYRGLTDTIPTVVSTALPSDFAVYADETNHNHGRFRALGAVAIKRRDAPRLNNELAVILRESGVREFKWSKLDTAQNRLAAEKMVDWMVRCVLQGEMRVHGLVWDTQDSRHSFAGRDDIANLGRMYYRILSSVFRDPLFATGTWLIVPDRIDTVDWVTLAEVLANTASRTAASTGPQLALLSRLARQFGVVDIVPTDSHHKPLVQLADFVAGLTVFSREKYPKLLQWRRETEGKIQPSLFGANDSPVALTNSERERCRVLARLNGLCKQHRLGVSLDTNGGLHTFPPGRGLSFWLYVPQHDRDRAPSRSERVGRKELVGRRVSKVIRDRNAPTS